VDITAVTEAVGWPMAGAVALLTASATVGRHRLSEADTTEFAAVTEATPVDRCVEDGAENGAGAGVETGAAHAGDGSTSMRIAPSEVVGSDPAVIATHINDIGVSSGTKSFSSTSHRFSPTTSTRPLTDLDE
jgi:hypothetical protein